MSVLPVAAALVVATASIAALASADSRLGLVGLAAALLAAGLVADPLPGPAVLGVRLTAALLAAAVLRAAIPMIDGRRRTADPGDGQRSHLGWPAELLLGLGGGGAGLALSAGMAGFAPVGSAVAAPTTTFLGGSMFAAASLALALGGGIIAISVPAVIGGAGLRRATAAVLSVTGVVLARYGLAGSPSVLEEVVMAVLLVTIAGAAGLLAGAGRPLNEGPRRA